MKRVLSIAALVLIVLPGVAAAQELFDVIIRGGTVIDGTGAGRVQADVGLRGQRIVAISATPLQASGSTRIVNASGLIVAPGFIDLHAHLEPLAGMPSAESHVRQGVTLAVGGPDGGSPLPLGAYMDSVGAKGLGLNVAMLIGHNTVRSAVMGGDNRAPTADELRRMEQLIANGMRDGAFGMSTGLRYIPGYYSKTDEVVALARVAASFGGIYTSHLREEGLGLIEGVTEAIEIGRQAKIPIVLTHHKSIGREMWGSSVRTLRMIDEARAEGIDVMADQYPYTASSTSLSVLIPPWALANGDSAFARRVRNPVLRDSIERGVIELLLNDRGGGDLRRVQFGRVTWKPDLEGRTLHAWAVERGVDTVAERAAALVIEGQLKGGASMIYHVIDEQDVQRIMKHPQTMIASDGRLTKPGDGQPHPRAYGTFPRVLGHYVRDLGLMSLEEGVHKMTGLPAKRLGLSDRGTLRVGAVADITIFSAERISDQGTFTNPHQYPLGILHVIVNGTPVVVDGAYVGARPGIMLKHQARR